MSNNIRKWLAVSTEEAGEATVIVQEGETPKEDFSAAANAESSTVETAAPAVVELPAASADAPEQEVVDQGHQEVRISAEETGETTEVVVIEMPEVVETVIEEVKGDTEIVVVEVEPEAEVKEDVPEVVEEVSVEEVAEIVPEDVAADVEQVPVSEVVIVEQAANTVEVPMDVVGTEENQVVTDENGDTVIGGDGEPLLSNDETLTSAPVTVVDEAPVVHVEVPVSPDEAAVYAADVGDETEIVIASEAFASTQQDVEHLMKIQVALEGYGLIIAKGLESGDGILPETATAIRIGMESIDAFFAEENLVPSQEAFDNNSRLAATTLSMEGFSEGLTQVVTATKNAIQKLFDHLYELWVAMTGGANRALTRLQSLKEKTKELPSAVTGGKRELSGAGRLSVVGHFKGLDKKAVADIAATADYMYRQYPDQIKGLVKDALGVYNSVFKPAGVELGEYDVNTVIVEFFRAIKQNIKPIAGAQPVATSHLPVSLQGYQNIRAGKTLVGDRAVVQFINTDPKSLNLPTGETGYQLLATYARFNRLFNVQFVALINQDTTDKVVYDLPSKREIEGLIDELEGLLKQVVAGENKRAIYGDAQKALRETSDKIAATIPKELGRDNTKVISYAAWLTNLQSLAAMLTQPAGQFNSYVVGTCNAFIGLLEHCVAELNASVVEGEVVSA